jgi:hypothetical protein
VRAHFLHFHAHKREAKRDAKVRRKKSAKKAKVPTVKEKMLICAFSSLPQWKPKDARQGEKQGP